ncbi:MAG: hypothetical protein ABFD54_10835 [Armatimonadota bacterium]|nr:hypothetical protein [bacterium]
MESRHGNIIVRTGDRNIEALNGRVMVRLLFCDGGYVQEFYAVNRAGDYVLLLSSLHKNLITSSEHRMCASPMISGDRPHLFGVCRESLRMVYSNADVTAHDENHVVIDLTGSVMGHSLTCRIVLADGENSVHIAVKDNIVCNGYDPLIEYLMSSYVFIPGRAPVTLGHEIDYTWAPLIRPANDQLIGDCAFHSPAAIIQHGPAAAALVPDLHSIEITRPMPVALDLDLQNGLLSAPLISYGFCGYEPTSDNNYCRHDITMAKRVSPPMLEYAYHLMLDGNCKRRSAFHETADFVWKHYGSRFTIKHTHPHSQSRQNETENAVDAILSAPKVWEDDKACCYTAECSEQLYWLLMTGKDKRIVPYCRSFADFLISKRLRSGAIPAWFTNEKQALPHTSTSICTAAAALFLARLAKVTKLKMYARAAEQSAKFVLNELVPKRLFQDSLQGLDDNPGTTTCADPHSGTVTQGGWGMLWTAMMCLELHELTGVKNYLDQGIAVLDQLCLLQCVWDRPWDTQLPPAGMLVRGNVGWVADPLLTAEFARCATHYGATTGSSSYFERGAAALKAAMGAQVDCPATQLKIAASSAAIGSEFGDVFVHVSRKWAVPLNGLRVGHVEFGRSAITLDLDDSADGRIVFGGMRGHTYKLSAGGRQVTCSSEEMLGGVALSDIRRGGNALRLFDSSR